ncbi:MAG: phage exclusion protein Lit family protein [Candidatus Acidiferrales bacterium]
MLWSMSPSPLLQLDEAVSRAAFAAAPEKAEDLFTRVRHIKLNFVYEHDNHAGRFEFSSSPRLSVINIHQGALELLWAASFAFPMLFRICRDSQQQGRDRMNATDFPELQQAFRLYGWALNKCCTGVCEPWPREFPSPQNGDLQTRLATELFLVAVGWILLHESAHILLGHKIDGPNDLKKREECEADRFATEWLLQGVTDSTMLQKRSLGIAIANLILIALDLRAERLDLLEHPRSVERLNDNLRNYLPDADTELAYALAIAVLQAHFWIFGVNHTIDHDAAFGFLLDGLCTDLTRHRFQ